MYSNNTPVMNCMEQYLLLFLDTRLLETYNFLIYHAEREYDGCKFLKAIEFRKRKGHHTHENLNSIVAIVYHTSREYTRDFTLEYD